MGRNRSTSGFEALRFGHDFRRFDRPAVVFAPTSAIQRQWREQLRMFSVTPAELDDLVSLESRRLASVNVFTYQLLSSPAEADEQLRSIALAD